MTIAAAPQIPNSATDLSALDGALRAAAPVLWFRLPSGAMTAGAIEWVEAGHATVRYAGARGPKTVRIRLAAGASDLLAPAPRLDARTADAVTAALTGFASFADLVNAPGNYRPTILNVGLYALLANTYDAAQRTAGDPRRAFRRTA